MGDNSDHLDERVLLERDERTTCINWMFVNVLLLGLSFMLVFSAFQTNAIIETLVLEGAKYESNNTFTGDGYISLSIIYAVFAASNWLAPPVVALIGAKWSMFVGGTIYCGFIASLIRPITWLLYVMSALLGFGAAILWTAQGNFLTVNSNSETMGRNSGVFWAMLECSLLFGNLYVYFKFTGISHIEARTRIPLYIILTVVCGIGTLTILLLRTKTTTTTMPDDNTEETTTTRNTTSPLRALKNSIHLLFTREMAMLFIMFFYLGIEQSFWGGIYSTSVGHTDSFGLSAKQLASLCGIFIGIGEIIGGAVFGLLGSRINRWGRDSVVLFGLIVHTVCFYLIFLNLPDQSPIGETNGATYIQPNQYIVILSAFLLGLGDSSFNTQVYSLLGSVYMEDSAPAFALYKFIQSLGSAASYLISRSLVMHWQLLTMTGLLFIGSLLFFIVEWSVTRRTLGYVQIQDVKSD